MIDLEKIREISIHKVLGLKGTGRTKMKCPFHTKENGRREKTPSFYVFENNTFKCFGCGVHGKNAIDLLMADGTSFIEAVKELREM